jgi:hypothetical protein
MGMSRVGEKRDCPTCHKLVEVIELTATEGKPGSYIQKLSCGDTARIRIMDSVNETISASGKVEAEVKTVKTLGEAPMLVTDNLGTHLTSGSMQISLNQGGNVIGGTYNFGPVTYLISNTTINNIQNILSMIDSHPTLTGEQKQEAKNALTKIIDLIKAYGPLSVEISKYLQLVLPGLFH